jgi:hypothetical protein
MRIARPPLFTGFKDFSLGRTTSRIGQDFTTVPIMVWNEKNYPQRTLKQKGDKKITLVSLPDRTDCILRQNAYRSSKLAEEGAKSLNQILGFDHIPNIELACHSDKASHPETQDIFVLQDFIPGVTVQDGLKSPEWKALVNKALDDPKNLIPLYIQMVISGDSDRHNENMIVDKQGKLWSFDYEYSGGHDFYTYPGYESFTTQPELEERFARGIPFLPEVKDSLKRFVENRVENEQKLAPYYGHKRLKGFFERADILRKLGKTIPTQSLFPLLRGTFYPLE